MVPDIKETGTLLENEPQIYSDTVSTVQEKREYHWIWYKVLLHLYIHSAAVYGIYLMFSSAHLYTALQVLALYLTGCVGVTAGAHRLWSHRAYKATWQLRLILITLQTITAQTPVLNWARVHRLHHKYSETHADPHNVRNGFFYAHFGWLMCKKHPMVEEKCKNVDFSDLTQDPFVYNQKKYFIPLSLTMGFILPVWASMHFWGETFNNAYHLNMLRYVLMINVTFLTNSVSHMVGWKPYDRFVGATNANIVSFLILGEGSHNYHHTFPWDYRTAELGKLSMNFSTNIINMFAKIGWAYDLKSASDEMIKKRVLKTGDGSHEIWGWGDKDQVADDYQDASITYKKNKMENTFLK